MGRTCIKHGGKEKFIKAEVKLSLCLIKEHHAMKTNGGMEV
jgi:hypothetical protein